MNKTTAYHFLRVGLAITFLWIGVLIFRNPEAWGSYMQPWALKLLPLPLVQMMLATAALDILIGIFLLIDVFSWAAALVAALHLLVVIATSGITDITVRDIGLFTAALAICFDSWPEWAQCRREEGTTEAATTAE